jgi:hypothetical protein
MAGAGTQIATAAGGAPRPYDPARPLFSLHVPKTAGTSFRRDLEGWFGDDLVLHYRGDQGEPPARHALRPGLCVHGHFNRLRNIGVRRYYPEAGQFIVLLRDPFDRFVSTWRYLHFQVRSGVSQPDFADRPDLETWLDRRRRAVEAVTEAQDPFSFLAQLADAADPSDPAAVFGPEYLAVGVSERYAQSVALFAAVLGRRAPQTVTRLNLADEPHREGDPTEARPDLRGLYERCFPLEYAVYEAAAARLEAGRRALGL